MTRRRTELVLTFAAFAGGCSVSCAENSGAGGDATPVPDDAAARFSEARCSAFVGCGCGSRAVCDQEHADPFSAMLVTLEGATFDSACFEQVIDGLASLACDETSVPDCTLFEGRVPEGKACKGYNELNFSASNCAPGLACISGQCEKPGAIVVADEGKLGDFCDPRAGSEGCSAGLYCQQSESRCAPELQPGDPCYQPRACDIVSFCRGFGEAGEGTCSPLLALDEACDVADDERVCGPVCPDDLDYCVVAACIAGRCALPVEPPLACFPVQSRGGG